MGLMSRLKSRLSLKSNQSQELELFNKISSLVKANNEFISVSELLPRAAKLYPADTALIYKNRSLSYADFFFRAAILAEKLKDSGVKPSDRVILYFENSIEFFVGYFAIWHLGAIAVPLNVFLHQRELALIFKDSQPTAIITSSALEANIYKLNSSCPEIELPAIFSEKDMDFLTPLPAVLNDILETYKPAKFEIDKLCLLLYTSGTTGVPKGVMLSSRNILTNTSQCLARLCVHVKAKNLLYQEKFFAALPLFHVFAQNTCIWVPVICGGAIVIVPKIDRKEIFEALAEKPTIFFGVPALYGLLSLFKTASLDKIKFFVSGGDALPDKIRSAFAMIYGRKICSGYGLTEASPVVAVNMENQDRKTMVVGRPLAGIKCEIRSPEGKVLKNGEVGELCISGDNVMLGYYKSLELTSEVLENGWLHTGDLATIDEEGNISIVGRSKDLIIHKGFNIYPQEVENILMSHPAVFKAAVIGRDDATSGQVPVAFVALKAKEDKNIEKKLRDFCTDHLATYKIPRKFICLDDLPMNQGGKIDKRRLINEHSD